MTTRTLKHVVSISGGKDSTATALYARETVDTASIIYVTADTSNEHPLTYEYLDYLEDVFGAPIVRLKTDFAARIEQWERCVALASKCGAASFFPAPNDGRRELQGANIRERVEWARTSLGGRQHDLFADIQPPACSSHYALCE